MSKKQIRIKRKFRKMKKITYWLSSYSKDSFIKGGLAIYDSLSSNSKKVGSLQVVVCTERVVDQPYCCGLKKVIRAAKKILRSNTKNNKDIKRKIVWKKRFYG